MERAAFLIEETNQRIGCLLNPESLVVWRTAGLRSRQSVSGQLTGAGQVKTRCCIPAADTPNSNLICSSMSS